MRQSIDYGKVRAVAILGRGPRSRLLAPLFVGSVVTLASVLTSAAPPNTPLPPETPPATEPSPDSVDPQQLQRMQEQIDALAAEVEKLRAELDEERARPAPAPAPVPVPQLEAEPETKPVGSVADGQRPPGYADGFHFGSYGRVSAAGDLRGRPGRDADIVGR